MSIWKNSSTGDKVAGSIMGTGCFLSIVLMIGGFLLSFIVCCGLGAML